MTEQCGCDGKTADKKSAIQFSRTICNPFPDTVFIAQFSSLVTMTWWGQACRMTFGRKVKKKIGNEERDKLFLPS